MGQLYDRIKAAIRDERVVVSWHADERCEERKASAWQLAGTFEEAVLVRERPRSKPNPSVVVRHALPDGTEVEAIWSWLETSGAAKLVTFYEVS